MNIQASVISRLAALLFLLLPCQAQVEAIESLETHLSREEYLGHAAASDTPQQSI